MESNRIIEFKQSRYVKGCDGFIRICCGKHRYEQRHTILKSVLKIDIVWGIEVALSSDKTPKLDRKIADSGRKIVLKRLETQ